MGRGRELLTLAIRQVTHSDHKFLLAFILQDGHCFQVSCIPMDSPTLMTIFLDRFYLVHMLWHLLLSMFYM